MDPWSSVVLTDNSLIVHSTIELAFIQLSVWHKEIAHCNFVNMASLHTFVYKSGVKDCEVIPNAITAPEQPSRDEKNRLSKC